MHPGKRALSFCPGAAFAIYFGSHRFRISEAINLRDRKRLDSDHGVLLKKRELFRRSGERDDRPIDQTQKLYC
jgi:hypothetical protein